MKTAHPHTWMPLYIGDYLKDTMVFECAEEHGAYMLLMIYYWKNGGAIKADEKFLRQVCKLSHFKWKKIAPKLLGFFYEKDGFLTHEFLDKELDKAREQQQTFQKRSKKANEAKRKLRRLEEQEAREPEPFNPRKIIFAEGLRYIMSKGIAEKQARSLLGKWRKEAGDGHVVEALKRVSKEDISDPVAFIEKFVRSALASSNQSLVAGESQHGNNKEAYSASSTTGGSDRHNRFLAGLAQAGTGG